MLSLVRPSSGGMSAGQTILDQLFSQIAGACLHKSIEPLHPAATTRVFATSPNQKGIAQLFAAKLFCQITELQHLIEVTPKYFACSSTRSRNSALVSAASTK
jgi:hypothetical protein